MVKCQHCAEAHPDHLRYCPTTGELLSPERFFPPGMILDGKYRLGAILGVGGMGAVIEATHVMLDKRVAIKLLLPSFEADQEMTARLMREARAASATGHRNIAAVTDMGRTSEGTLYVVMERLTGRSLDKVIRSAGSLPLSRAAHLTAEILLGLEAVHRKGIVHRDLKPANIMVCNEEDGSEAIKILDFGISKVSCDERAPDFTTVGKVLGTPQYMSPEQARGIVQVDHRVDIYAAGTILYHMLTGEPPFSGPNYNAVIAAILEGSPPAASSRVPGLPPAVDAVLRRAMARSSGDRFADALSFRKALLPFLASRGATTQLGVGLAADDRYEEQRPVQGSDPGFELLPVGAQLSADASPGAAAELEVEPEEDGAGTVAPQPAPLPARPSLMSEVIPLAVDPRPQRSPRQEPTLYQPPRPGLPSRTIKRTLVVILACAGLMLAWCYWEEIWAKVTGFSGPGQVLIMIETEPRDAEVYVDGVLQVSQPVALPRSSDRVYSIRVQAPGFMGEIRQVRADASQSVRVRLRRRRD